MKSICSFISWLCGTLGDNGSLVFKFCSVVAPSGYQEAGRKGQGRKVGVHPHSPKTDLIYFIC